MGSDDALGVSATDVEWPPYVQGRVTVAPEVEHLTSLACGRVPARPTEITWTSWRERKRHGPQSANKTKGIF
jgi:hypothetical protein